VAEDDRAQHFFLGQLIGFRFHHHHGVLGAGDDQVQTLFGVVAKLVHVGHFGVQHIGAVRKADARGGDRAHEGDAGNRQRGGGRDHRDDVGIVDEVVA
jgi:hypothetical protein